MSIYQFPEPEPPALIVARGVGARLVCSLPLPSSYMAPWTETMTVMPSSSSAAVKVYEQWKYPAVGVVVGVGVGGRVSLLTGVHVQGAGLPSRRLNAVGVPRIAVAMIAADPVLHVDLSVASRRGLITRSITPLPWFAEVKVYLRLGHW